MNKTFCSLSDRRAKYLTMVNNAGAFSTPYLRAYAVEVTNGACSVQRNIEFFFGSFLGNFLEHRWTATVHSRLREGFSPVFSGIRIAMKNFPVPVVHNDLNQVRSRKFLAFVSFQPIFTCLCLFHGMKRVVTFWSWFTEIFESVNSRVPPPVNPPWENPGLFLKTGDDKPLAGVLNSITANGP